MRLILLIFLVAYVNSSIYDISQNEYGKTVLQAMQLTLNDASFTETINLLQQLKDGIQNEQTQDDDLISQRQEQCSIHIQENTETLTNTLEKLAASEEQITPLEQKLLDKRHQADDKAGEEQRNNDRINKLIAARQQSRSEYEAKRDELTTIVGALNDAKRLIQQIKIDPTALIQFKQHRENFLSYVQKSSMYGLIHSVLSQVKETGQEKIIRIIDDLIEEVYAVQKLEMIVDDQREADFIKTKIRYEFANNRLSTKIAELQADVEQFRQQLLELNNNVAVYKDLSELKTSELKDWQKSCDDAQNSHNNLTDYRNGQIAIIDECIQLLSDHNPEVVQFIQTYH